MPTAFASAWLELSLKEFPNHEPLLSVRWWVMGRNTLAQALRNKFTMSRPRIHIELRDEAASLWTESSRERPVGHARRVEYI